MRRERPANRTSFISTFSIIFYLLILISMVALPRGNQLQARDKLAVTGNQKLTLRSTLNWIKQVFAQDSLLFMGGNIEFNYQQFPFGNMKRFSVAGVLDTSMIDSLLLMKDTVEVVTGGYFSFQGYYRLGFTGIKLYLTPNDTSLDVFTYLLSSDSVITPGDYPVSPLSEDDNSWFFLALGVDTLSLPDVNDTLNLEAITEMISADTLIVSTNGNFNFTTINGNEISGTFTGEGGDIVNMGLYTFQQGNFLLNHPYTFPVAIESFEREPSENYRLTLFPNPANPGQVIKVSLPFSAREYKMELVNLLGKDVASFELNGSESFVINFQDTFYPSGVYLIFLKDYSGKILAVSKLTIIK